MYTLIDRYIDRALRCANRPPSESEILREELNDHLQQKVEDLVATGLPKEEAVFKALRDHGNPAFIGYKLRRGFPWIDVRTQGTARGVIAIGPKAIGIFAFGGLAFGVVSVGGLSCGLISIGGLAIGALVWGGAGLGGIVLAGAAIGLVAFGGFALGLVAAGGKAIAFWAPQNKFASSYYTAENVPLALKQMEWFLRVPEFFSRHMEVVMPLYLLLLGLLITIQIREGKRVQQDKDWLIED